MFDVKSKKKNVTIKDDQNNVDILRFIYIIILALFAILLFLYGFVPLDFNQDNVLITNEIPRYVGQYRVKTDDLYQPMIDKVIIMVIDAFRWDFVANPKLKSAMPHLHNIIENNSACILQATVSPPTVTMPRIKAMTGGIIPSFMDVIFNFGSKAFASDNVIQQTVNQDKKVVFYGDDTWIKLFPGLFERSDGTSSFFVTDYTEVDNNVTRHIDKEFNNNDWTIMILHYLGLDHIGHIEGPNSLLIKPKLEEMDEIIGRIQNHMSTWKQKKMPIILMLCGDHGMKDSGGHGGSSLQETLVPVIFIGTECSTNLIQPAQISQIDIASILSVLLGIPIPNSNLGTISMDIFNNIPTSKKLFLLYYNAKQIFQYFKQLPNYKTENAYSNYITAIKLHTAWINTNGQNDDIVIDIIQLYISALTEMKNILSSKLIHVNIFAAISAIMLLLHTLHISLSKKNITEISIVQIWLICFIYIIIYFILRYLFKNEDNYVNNEKGQIYIVINTVIFIICIIYIHNKLIGYSLHLPSIHKIKSFNVMQFMFYFGSILHIISLGSSSFIEEEHQTWYYLWTTFLSLIIYKNIMQYIFLNDCYRYINLKTLFIKIISLLIAHRIFRNLNSTGDKYAHLPDISDWLLDDKSKISMTLILIIGLCSLILIGYKTETKKSKLYFTFLYATIGFCIYLRHMNNNSVISIPSFITKWLPNEIYLFWNLLTLDFIYDIYIIINRFAYLDKQFKTICIYIILRNWIVISAFLHRPYNVALIALELINSSIISNVSKTFLNDLQIIQFHIWLGYVFHFYQGNSNNLATIDVTAGYIGLETYNPTITGLFLVINTFSSFILSYFLILYRLVERTDYSFSNVLMLNQQYIIWQLFTIIMCCILVGLQRYHLFIWTVFFPKLLYEAALCAVLFCIILITMLLFGLKNITVSIFNRSRRFVTQFLRKYRFIF